MLCSGRWFVALSKAAEPQPHNYRATANVLAHVTESLSGTTTQYGCLQTQGLLPSQSEYSSDQRANLSAKHRQSQQIEPHSDGWGSAADTHACGRQMQPQRTAFPKDKDAHPSSIVNLHTAAASINSSIAAVGIKIAVTFLLGPFSSPPLPPPTELARPSVSVFRLALPSSTPCRTRPASRYRKLILHC